METPPENKVPISYPEGLSSRDIELVNEQCEYQGAIKKEQIEGFASAYLEAKELVTTHKEKFSALTGEEIELLILHFAERIEGQKGYSSVPRTFADGSRAIDPENIPRAMESFSEAYAERRIEPEDVYQEFETIHPFNDGNGRIGDLLWKMAVTRKTGEWPESLPPPYKNRK